MGEWMDIMLSQEAHLLCSAVTLIINLEGVESEVDKTLDLLSQELETQDKYFYSWLKLEDFKLVVLIDNGVLPSRYMHIE